MESSDEVPEDLRRMVRGEPQHINMTSDEIICIFRDVRKYASMILDVDDSTVPTKEAYSMAEMRERKEFYDKVGWDESAEFIQEVIEAVEDEYDE